MNRVKVSEWITTVNGLCCFLIVLGVFLPFAKIEIWGYELGKLSIFQLLTAGDLAELIGEDYMADFMGSVGLCLLAFIASLAGGLNFKNNINLTPAIIMIIAGFFGKYMIEQVTDFIFDFGVVKELMGATLLMWGYKILVWTAIAAFVVNFYLLNIAKSDDPLSNTVNSIIGVNSIVCTNCGKTNVNNKYCSACGYALEKISNLKISSFWTCGKCGTENKETSRFCSQCGNSQ